MSQGQHKNKPYVKQYDAQGNLINPIKGGYYSQPIRRVFNRSKRRELEKILKKILKRGK